jgi:hypothetical protein
MDSQNALGKERLADSRGDENKSHKILVASGHNLGWITMDVFWFLFYGVGALRLKLRGSLKCRLGGLRLMREVVIS